VLQASSPRKPPAQHDQVEPTKIQPTWPEEPQTPDSDQPAPSGRCAISAISAIILAALPPFRTLTLTLNPTTTVRNQTSVVRPNSTVDD
jgi:hypothetical protein